MSHLAVDYRQFLEGKIKLAKPGGFEVEFGDINPVLKPHQRAIVQWAVRGGKRAIFASFGLGKSIMQLETVRLCLNKTGGRGLIVIPLGVRTEFQRDADMLGTPIKFIRRIEEAGATGIYLTNYETVRDGKLDPSQFQVASLDEASVLRGFGGVKTFREFMALFADDARDGRKGSEVKYRFVATATPSPNEYIELLAYAAFLGVMDIGQAKTRWFQRNSEKNDDLTLYPHKEDEFWKWVASWAVFVQRPSDLGFDDTGYVLPPLNVHWHEVPSDHSKAGADRGGQGLMFRNAAISVSNAAREKRDTLNARVARLTDILRGLGTPGAVEEQPVIWCDLNAEQKAIEAALKAEGMSFASLTGNQPIEEREELLAAWKRRLACAFVSKPSMYGCGLNMQQAHTMVFVGIGYKFQDLIQAIHRIYRFLQDKPCDVHLIYSEAERDIRASIEEKWTRHNEQAAIMSRLIREHGLATNALADGLVRTIGCEREERSGETWRIVRNDCVEETRSMAENSVDLIVTSIPFEGQYEYSPSYNDFGHTESSAEFWSQMDYLIPELYRTLKPGRVCAIHVKDRITPGGINGFGFQTVTPISDYCTANFVKHGFAFLARKTIVTDVVRENNQTYRLGWSEQCKDGSRQGAGLPEYLMMFRKPPTDRSNGYADTPVVKQKPLANRLPRTNPRAVSDAERAHCWETCGEEPGWCSTCPSRDARAQMIEDGLTFLTAGEIAALRAELAALDEQIDDVNEEIDATDTAVEDGLVEKQNALRKRFEQVCNSLNTVVPYEQGDAMIPGTGYSRSRWQIDAHGFTRSSGNRLVAPSDFVGIEAEAAWKLWKQHSLGTVYDFEHHVACCEAREAKKELPKTFFLMPPHSWHPDVWTDVARMRTLNANQAAKGKELHICPLPLDIVDRAITQCSMPGETVFDPFAGIGTVPYCAVKLKRKGVGVELNADYVKDAVWYCEAAEAEAAVPSLFDLIDEGAAA